MNDIIPFLFTWLHLLAGITWIGMLYYFNFVQAEYFKEASAEGLADAKSKLAPRALLWFRMSSAVTLVTGLILIGSVAAKGVFNDFIVLGILLGSLMFANVWHVIWPNQKVILGIKEGDVAVAAAKASLGSRTNTLFSTAVVFCMLASSHIGYSADFILKADGGGLGLVLAIILLLILEANAIFGKVGPMASIRGVVHLSLALTAVLFCLVLFL